MKAKIIGLLLTGLFGLVIELNGQWVTIIGPAQVNTTDIAYYQMMVDVNQNPPCNYSSYSWQVSGGTILQQSVNPIGLVYCQIQWNAAPGTADCYVKLYGTVSNQPPATCFEGTYLLTTLNITIGNPVIDPASQYAPYYGANALYPICVSMPGVTINSYQWRDSYDGLSWNIIGGATSSCYQPTNVTGIKYYSCVLGTSFGTYYSPSAFVSFLELDPGTIYTNNNSPDFDTDPYIIQSSAMGGYCSGTYQYSWEMSVENGPWTEVGTGVNFPVGTTIIGSTKIRRKVSCGPFEILYTNTLVFNPVYVSGDYENRNYVREISVLTKGIVSSQLADALPVGDKLQSTTYLDGLGRPIQTVDKGVSPAGANNWKDIVKHYEYYEAGRTIKDFLPYASSDNAGKFKTNAATAQPAYITSFFGEASDAPTYSLIEYDENPLNRLKKVTAPGEAWIGKGVATAEDFNKDNEKVHIWSLDYSQSALPVSSPALTYSTGKLLKNLSEDENQAKVITYTDFSGNLILKKVQEKGGADLTIEHDGWVCTYYVYDDLNRLRYIISPKAVVWLDDHGWDISQPIADELCYKYLYDEKGRIINKKQPGVGEEKMIYDKKDRLVLTQHANQADQWSFVLYDDLDRTVATGLFNNSQSQSTLQGAVNALPDGMVMVTAYLATAGSPSLFVEKPVINLSGVTNIMYNSVSYYDNYTYPGAKSFISSGYTLAYSISDPNIEPIVKTDRTTGMVTGEKIRILDGDNNYLNDHFLYSTVYYDETGRAIETLVDNIKMNNGSGVDYQVSQYDFSGKLMSSFTNHKPGGTVSYTITSKNEFDKVGRLTRLSKNFNNSFYKQLAEYGYDELGQLKTKRLAPGYTGTGGSEIEMLTYDYNIQGWLTGINKDYALSNNDYEQWDHYFGMYLGYRDNLFQSSQYNGSIAGIIWKSQGDNSPRIFDYAYDRLGRFTQAQFNQRKKPSDGLWSNAEVDFSTYVDYKDGNGNIKSMKHMGIIPGVNSGVTVDDLQYSYVPTSITGLNGNQLQKIDDDLNTLGSNNGLLGDFRGADDPQTYFYDANGNLIKDLNKNIKDVSNNGITYNFMNKPEKIVIEDKSVIEFTYDASGEKLAKKMIYADQSTRLTTYIGDYIYEEFTASDGGSADGEQLLFVLHEEGRLKIVTPHEKEVGENNGYDLNAGDFGISNWPGGKQGVFEYFIKDNLGSARMVLTEEVQKEYYKATMEANAEAQEAPLFGQVDPNTGEPTDANEWRLTHFSNSASTVWAGNNTDLAKLTALSPNTVIGPNMVLKVMAGDIINSNVKYYFHDQSSSGSGDVLNLVGTSLVNSLTGVNSTALGKNQADVIHNSLTNNYDYVSFITNRTGTGTAPKAYLNIVFLDEQFKFIEQDPVTSTVGTNYFPLDPNKRDDLGAEMTLQQKAPKNGWAFIYISNQSNEPVYFDDLQITNEHSRIAEENHYYPFGLKMAGICSKAFNKLSNKYNYQGDFAENEEETGWDEFDLRMYDPQIGRWTGADPYDQFASPYISMGNNPVDGIDPNGGWTPGYTGALIGGAVGIALPYVIDWINGKKHDVSYKGIWAAVGGFVLSGVGYGFFESAFGTTNGNAGFFQHTAAFYEGLFGGGDGTVQWQKGYNGKPARDAANVPDIWENFNLKLDGFVRWIPDSKDVEDYVLIASKKLGQIIHEDDFVDGYPDYQGDIPLPPNNGDIKVIIEPDIPAMYKFTFTGAIPGSVNIKVDLTPDVERIMRDKMTTFWHYGQAGISLEDTRRATIRTNVELNNRAIIKVFEKKIYTIHFKYLKLLWFKLKFIKKK